MTVGASILTCLGWSEGHTHVCVAYILVRRRTFLSKSIACRSMKVHVGVAADPLSLPRLPGYRTPLHEVPRLLAPCTAKCHGCRLQGVHGAICQEGQDGWAGNNVEHTHITFGATVSR